MLTVGIDLSTDPARTGLARLRWASDGAEVEALSLGWSVTAMVEEIELAQWTAIDAPFGWPDRFIETILGWSQRGHWPEVGRETLRFRLTDERVKKTKNPLSVSSDRIASTAMVCAQLPEALAARPRWMCPLDRAGADGVVECYPAAALAKWEIPIKNYKGPASKNRTVREAVVSTLRTRCSWLELSDEQRDRCIERDDYLDALICGLVARVAALGLLDEPLPEDDELKQARREGWIFLPASMSLERLAG